MKKITPTVIKILFSVLFIYDLLFWFWTGKKLYTRTLKLKKNCNSYIYEIFSASKTYSTFSVINECYIKTCVFVTLNLQFLYLAHLLSLKTILAKHAKSIFWRFCFDVFYSTPQYVRFARKRKFSDVSCLITWLNVTGN